MYLSKKRLESLLEPLGDLTQQRFGGGYLCHGGGKGDSPPAPDYTAAANATAAGNLEATRAASAANRVNQITPYGSLTYTQDKAFDQAGYDAAMKAYNALPAASGRFASLGGAINAAPKIEDFYNKDGGWTATQTLSPAQQAIQAQTDKLNQGLMTTANSGLQYANNVLSHPGVDTSKLPQVGMNPGQTYQDAIMSRLQPQQDHEREMFQAQMAAQGIPQGSEAYTNGERDFNDQQAAKQVQAVTQGFNTGLSANQNAFQQESYNQMQPINLINALRTGSQVSQPNYVNVPQQATTAGADLLGAANSQYGAELGSANMRNAQSNALLGTAGQLGGAAMLATSMF